MPHGKLNWKTSKKTNRSVKLVKKKIFSFSEEPKKISNKMFGVNSN